MTTKQALSSLFPLDALRKQAKQLNSQTQKDLATSLINTMIRNKDETLIKYKITHKALTKHIISTGLTFE